MKLKASGFGLPVYTKIVTILIVAITTTSCFKEPIAQFDYECDSQEDKSNPKIGEEIQFVNNSQNANTYLWDFDTNETSTEANPIYVFEKADNYTISLMASGRGGESSYTKKIKILSLDGKWDGKMMFDQERFDFELTLDHLPNKLKGEFELENTTYSKLSKAQISKYNISFEFSINMKGKMVGFAFEGIVNNDYDEMEGVYYIDDILYGTWEADI